MPPMDTTARDIRLITFRVGDESFVLDIMAVRQIVPYSGSTPVPYSPEFVEGIIVLRNEVIPVIDLRARLFPGKGRCEGQPLIMILRTPDGTIGLKVEEVRRILTISTDEILSPPGLIRGIAGDVFLGIIQQKDELLLVLDLQTILTPEEKQTLRDMERVVSKTA